MYNSSIYKHYSYGFIVSLFVLAGCTTSSIPTEIEDTKDTKITSTTGKPIKLFKEDALGDEVPGITVLECLKCQDIKEIKEEYVPAKEVLKIHNTAMKYMLSGGREGREDFWINFVVNGTNEYYQFVADRMSTNYLMFIPSGVPNYCDTCEQVVSPGAAHEHDVVPVDKVDNDATEE